MTAPVPDGFRLTLDVTARRLTDELWFGGTPPRVIRLTPAGRQAWTELEHAPVSTRTQGALARRFTDIGIAHPDPPAAAVADVTVVVPVRDRTDELDRCLASLHHDLPKVVVDDGSLDAEGVKHVCARHGAILLRHEDSAGPAAARNTALTEVHTRFVAFFDSDCVARPGWLERLLAHLADPAVGAAAPRIAGSAPDTWAGRFTRARGSLDLGAQPARVVPGGRVTYVPTAALVVRTDAVRQLGAFDESLRVGEDVDLVWRLHDAGWRIRYDPSVEVNHREPVGWRELLHRRFRYGTSAASLGIKHPDKMAPLVLHPWPALTVAGLVTRTPAIATLGFAAAVAGMARTLRRADVPTPGLLPSMGRAVYQTWLGVGRYGTQFAAPVLIAGLVPRRTRLAAAALLLGPPLDAWNAHRRALDPGRFTAAAIADDIAYGAGVWTGCVRRRTFTPIRPAVAWRPLRIDNRRS